MLGSVPEFSLKPVSVLLSEHDHMHRAHLGHYFGVGLSAAWILRNILNCREGRLHGPAPIRRVLDFGSGAGRVARFLRSLLPQAEVQVADLRKGDVAWCVENLGCVAAPDPLPDGAYDLIWLGSVFTHVPKDAAEKLLARLLPALATNGVLAFSSGGRMRAAHLRSVDDAAAQKARWLRSNLSAEQVDLLLEAYEATGYGYVDYVNQTGYGIALVEPHWYSRTVFGLGDFTQIYFAERDFDDHQDVHAFMARPLLGPRTNRFIELGAKLAQGDDRG